MVGSMLWDNTDLCVDAVGGFRFLQVQLRKIKFKDMTVYKTTPDQSAFQVLNYIHNNMLILKQIQSLPHWIYLADFKYVGG